MNPQDEARDALTDAYRKASADDAGRPSAAVRNAILAEATAATRRRTPAANDSRYLWRGVAGVAVLGFALLLWQQVDHQMPGDAPAVVAVPAEFESNKLEAAAPTTESVAAEAQAESASPASPASPASRQHHRRRRRHSHSHCHRYPLRNVQPMRKQHLQRRVPVWNNVPRHRSATNSRAPPAR